MDTALDYSTLFSNAFTIGASGIAIYLFIFKRKSIASAFQLLLNYSYQLSLSELKEKLERLNDLNASADEQCASVINIFNEIVGQIRGNSKLKKALPDFVKRVEKVLANEGELNEPVKRALVAELRERLRHLNVKNIDPMVGEE